LDFGVIQFLLWIQDHRRITRLPAITQTNTNEHCAVYFRFSAHFDTKQILFKYFALAFFQLHKPTLLYNFTVTQVIYDKRKSTFLL